MLTQLKKAGEDFTSINFERATASVSKCMDSVYTMNYGLADLVNYLDQLNSLVQEYAKIEPNVEMPIDNSYRR